MVNKLPILAIFVLILSVSPVLAVWESATLDVWLGENNNELIEGLNVRVISVDITEREAEIVVTDNNKRILYQGVITSKTGYEGKKLKIYVGDFRYKDAANEQVKLRLEVWVDAKFTNAHFPELIYKTDAYKAFAVVQNNANEDATFVVELSAPENMHAVNSGAKNEVEYIDDPKNPLPSTSQEILVKSGTSKKIYFEIQTNAKEGAKINPTLKLMTRTGALIDELKIKEISITSNLVGYLEDIVINPVMFSGSEEQIKVKVRSSWIGVSEDFRVKLIAPEFDLNYEQQSIRAYPRQTQAVNFRAVPFGGGKFTVLAELSIGTKIVDVLAATVEVVGEKIYEITKVEAPKSVMHDRQGIIFITIKNKGINQNTLLLKVESDDFSLSNSEAVIKLDAGKETRALFNIEPTKSSGSGTVKINLYTIPVAYKTSLYRKQDKLIDSESIRINIQNIDAKPKEETKEVVVEVTETVEEVTETVEEIVEVTETVEAPPTEYVSAVSLEDYWPYVIVLILVVLAIVIIATSGGKKAKIEIYDVEKKKKKSRKRKKS